MPADRFFLDAPLLANTLVELTGPELHHLRVMRIAPGETIEVINGKGALASARVTALHPHAAALHLLSLYTEPPPPFLLHLVIPLLRPSKLEWVIEKGTELGADSFLLYRAGHSEKGELSSHQLERLRLLSLSALKQSGRLHLPPLSLFPSLADSLKGKEGLFLFGDTSLKSPSLSTVALTDKAWLITGPEKGFSAEEQEWLCAHGRGVSLSPFILRAETAPIAGVAILKSRFN